MPKKAPRASAPKKRKSAGEPPPMVDDSPVKVQIRTPANTYDLPEEVTAGLAMQWYFMVRNRRRWSTSFLARKTLEDRFMGRLESLGMKQEMLADCARAGICEVSIPYRSETEGWAARIFPWEFALRVASGKDDLTVIRHLDVRKKSDKPVRPIAPSPQRLLFVQSAPGPLGDYSFDTERCLVQGSLQSRISRELENPTLAEMTEAIRVAKPQVIHMAGFDLHQGDDLWNQSVPAGQQYEESDEYRWDGMYFSGGRSTSVDRVNSERLGEALNPKGAEGALVTFNIYHSAARIAALAVANGSAAAVGFQDVVDDALAERFFASLFQQWRRVEWSFLTAFHEAWRRVGISDGQDSGAVLWSRHSLIGQPLSERKKAPPKELEIGPDKAQACRVRVVPNAEVNYSLLHNGEGLFETFRFEKYQPVYAHGLAVEVELFLGPDRFPYAATFDLDPDEPVLDIASKVNLPLTSDLARSLREDVMTSLRVVMSYKGRTLCQETHRVKLRAVNQWSYDRTEGGRWLASFVLPGDPAVPRVVDAAQKYLMALRDDPGAGFDGYQSTDAQNPERRDEGVDMQVRALWAALSFDLPLSYINPPPVFTEGSQRVRTPSDVVGGKRGTCIDLALLLAACLEYVEIYPVLFILNDHVFPGYWRNEQAYVDFLAMRKAPDDSEDGYARYDASALSQKRLRYEEVRRWVRDGALVPLESVWLTQHRGFAEAVDAGIDNLRSSKSFESLVNIRKLRDENITPLPIVGAV